nr:glucose-methanol-choline oxidoreductase, FAD/NAD(P)-binding domain protein [Tanacetum cinerariifolium]
SVSVGSWFLILKEASSDFHCDKRIAWVETENTFKRIASRWGVFLSVDDQEDSCFHSKRLYAYGDEDSDDAISNDEGDKNQNSNIFGDDDDAEDGREHQVNEDPIEEAEVMAKEARAVTLTLLVFLI